MSYNYAPTQPGRQLNLVTRVYRGLHTIITAGLAPLREPSAKTRRVMPGDPGNCSLAKLFRDYGDRWDIEAITPGTRWIAINRDTSGPYIRTITAHGIDTLSYLIGVAERDEADEREPGI